MWWSNGEQRRAQKEMIKNAIKRTQVSKKATQTEQQRQPTSTTPPSLCHSMPTSAEYYPDSMPQTRSGSISSPYSGGYDYTQIPPEGYFHMPPPPPPVLSHPQYPMFSPYEVDIKTERQIFVNDIPTRRDSTMSTFSTYQPPPLSGDAPYQEGQWVQQERHESLEESFLEEEPVDFNFFDFPQGSLSPNHESIINVEECDRYLLNHFFEKVLKLIFPVLDANQHGSARTDVILPALESNNAYLHCCLSVAATHMKATEGLTGDQIDNDIVRHRYAAISDLCEALGVDENHSGILEATLGMIFFQCSVGRPSDALPDIPWHQHFQAVNSLVNKLDLPHNVLALASSGQSHPPFNMTLASWIDILGSTMLGRSPTFADMYRDLNLNGASAGLSELMGCDDKIMFLISEISCLEVQKSENIDEVILCKYVEVLADEIKRNQDLSAPVENCFSASGAVRPRQLATNITAVFRVAARVYLCSLVPGFESQSPSMCHLISQFSSLMNFIPAGPEGFDRSLAWPLLIAGSVSVAESPFRAMFDERCERLGDAADFGSFGRVRELLNDIWDINDAAAAGDEYQGVHWRDVMQRKGWDFLLI